MEFVELESSQTVISNTNNSVIFYPCDKEEVVGGYVINPETKNDDPVIFARSKKPLAWFRFWYRALLGWKWVDVDSNGNFKI